MWARSACGEPNEIKKKYPPEKILALFLVSRYDHEQHGKAAEDSKWMWTNKSDEHVDKLQDLMAECKDTGKTFEYYTPGEGAELMGRQLDSWLDKVLPQKYELMKNTLQAELHVSALLSRCSIYIASQQDAKLRDVVARHAITVVKGGPGSGKSSLMANFFNEYMEAHARSTVGLAHFVGCGDQDTTTLDNLLQRIAQEFLTGAGRYGDVRAFDPADKVGTAPEAIRVGCEAVARGSKGTKGGGTGLLVVESLSHIKDLQGFAWLPTRMPANFRVVVSVQDPAVLAELAQFAGTNGISLGTFESRPLQPSDCMKFAEEVLARSGKSLTKPQLRQLLFGVGERGGEGWGGHEEGVYLVHGAWVPGDAKGSKTDINGR